MSDLQTSWRSGLWLGIRLATVGSAFIATVEIGGAVFMSLPDYEPAWPWWLTLAAWARATLTHSLFWLIPLGVGGAVCGGIAARFTRACAERLLTALFVFSVMVVVVPADLQLAGFRSPWVFVLCVIFGLLLAVGTYFLVGRLRRNEPKRRALPTLTLIATGVVTACGLLIALYGRSPVFSTNPGATDSDRETQWVNTKPNLVVVVLDTVRADRLGVYDNDLDTTPFLSQWASNAVVYERAVANGMWTLPSHASMFTGLSQRGHGVNHEHQILDPSFTTLAEFLAEAGYQSASFSNNPLVSSTTNLTQGFDEVHVIDHLRYSTRFSLEHVLEKWGFAPPAPWLDRDRGAALTQQIIAEWLNTRVDPSKPCLLFVNLMEAHLPYTIPHPYRAMYMNQQQVRRSYGLRRRVYGNIVSAMSNRYNIEGPEFLSASDAEILRRQYSACIRYLDDRVKQLFKLLEEHGVFQNAIVIVASDHGEHLGAHGMWAHRFLTYDDLIHVAMMIKADGMAPARVDSPVQLSDVFPTALNLTLGVSSGEDEWGAHDLSVTEVQSLSDRIAISEYSGPAPGRQVVDGPDLSATLAHRIAPQVAVVDQRFKLMLSDDGTRQLFDLINDPGETMNQADVLVEHVDRLSQYARSWLSQTPRFSPESTSQENERLLDALRSLGYVGEKE